MSDFDTVLERLLVEPGFARALAADPAAALTGYRLAPGEVALLSSQVSTDPGGQGRVESRASKSSVFGLFTPLAGIGEVAATAVEHIAPEEEGISGSLAKAGLAEGRDGLGPAVRDDGIGAAVPTLPEGYRTRVDVDGDGDWDRHILLARSDGGVDIVADLNRDGRADFVGHDDDADRLVDSAEYDTDRDGVFDKRMYDDDGDGWLDRTVKHKS